MTLKDLGYNQKFEAFRTEQIPHSFEIGRIISEHKERLLLKLPEPNWKMK
jgi:ribosome biogenesis GTPase / thiamine phosphate phosphatase